METRKQWPLQLLVVMTLREPRSKDLASDRMRCKGAQQGVLYKDMLIVLIGDTVYDLISIPLFSFLFFILTNSI